VSLTIQAVVVTLLVTVAAQSGQPLAAMPLGVAAVAYFLAAAGVARRPLTVVAAASFAASLVWVVASGTSADPLFLAVLVLPSALFPLVPELRSGRRGSRLHSDRIGSERTPPPR
jgi:hypothetical protein